MASINQNFGNALVAAALRRGQVKTKDLLSPGMYDPALDWQQQSENLGYGQNVQDTALGGSRLHEQIFGGSGFYADPVTGARTDYSTPGALGQLAQSRQRGDQDYRTATGNLARQYRNQEIAQGAGARAAGVSHGGALRAALEKRSQNQAHDQSGLDTSWRRMVDDNAAQRNTVLSGAAQDQQNIDTSASRAGAANTLFNTQLGEAKVQSGQQMGTLPELPTPDFSAGYQTNQRFGNALAAAYYKRLGLPVPG
jgi:hypothetical protein